MGVLFWGCCGFYWVYFLDNLIWNADPDNYANSYDVKLFTICLCTIIDSDYICQEIELKLHLIIEGITKILINKLKMDGIKKDGTKSLKKKKQKNNDSYE